MQGIQIAEWMPVPYCGLTASMDTDILVVPTSCSKTLHTPNLLRWDKVTSRWTWLMAGCGSACIAIFHLGTLTTSTPIKVGCVCWVLWRKPQDSLVELADHAGRKGFWVQHMVCNAATYLHPTPSSCNLQRGLIGRILADANHSVEGTHPQEWQHVTSLVLPARLTSPCPEIRSSSNPELWPKG